ncbi:hypothetical protein [Devosia beringensis]|uniref:hypothetical protein n=1 Tax=Devosia beringensis TaxID=2657486 RepID=UPI00186B76B5|nr:hypothetical protein [Devosia beringensis]
MSKDKRTSSDIVLLRKATMTTPAKIQKILKRLNGTADVSADVRLPLERRLRLGLPQIEALRTWGLTWRQIALGLPSWTQKDGTAISADQLRGAVSRIRAKQKPRPAIAEPSQAALLVQQPPATRHQSVETAQHPISPGEPSRLSAQLALTITSRKPKYD